MKIVEKNFKKGKWLKIVYCCRMRIGGGLCLFFFVINICGYGNGWVVIYDWFRVCFNKLYFYEFVKKIIMYENLIRKFNDFIVFLY